MTTDNEKHETITVVTRVTRFVMATDTRKTSPLTEGCACDYQSVKTT